MAHAVILGFLFWFTLWQSVNASRWPNVTRIDRINTVIALLGFAVADAAFIWALFELDIL